jgi:hypothetical protein
MLGSKTREPVVGGNTKLKNKELKNTKACRWQRLLPLIIDL